MTTKLALSHHSREGLVIRHRGRGTFFATHKVIPESSQIPLNRYHEILGQNDFLEGSVTLAKGVEPAPEAFDPQLKLAPGELVIRIVRMLLLMGENMPLEPSKYPYAGCQNLADFNNDDQSICLHMVTKLHLIPDTAADRKELSVAGARAG